MSYLLHCTVGVRILHLPEWSFVASKERVFLSLGTSHKTHTAAQDPVLTLNPFLGITSKDFSSIFYL
jgi:hypothetical protein